MIEFRYIFILCLFCYCRNINMYVECMFLGMFCKNKNINNNK